MAGLQGLFQQEAKPFTASGLLQIGSKCSGEAQIDGNYESGSAGRLEVEKEELNSADH